MNTIAKIQNARTWQQWTTLINGAWQKGVNSIIETGEMLIQAKDEIGHGSYEAMVQGKLNFSPATARKLTAIAKNRVLSNRSHVNALPPNWGTLYELTKIDKKFGDGTLLAMIKDGTINPKTERKDVSALLKPQKPASKKTVPDTIASSHAAVLSKFPRADQIKVIRAVMEKLGIGIRDFADTHINFGR